MKKLLSVLLAALMVFSLCACAKNTAAPESMTPSENSSVAENIPAYTEEPAAEPPVTLQQPNAPPTEEQPALTAEAADSVTVELPAGEDTAAATTAPVTEPQETTTAASTTSNPPETTPATTTATEAPVSAALDENGSYTSRDDVALYIHTYGRLPGNFIKKKEAQALGWSGGSVEPYAPGKSIGGDRFGNYEGLLPEKEGRSYTECDIDTLGKNSRGAKRIVFSNDGLIYYTDDHYESFTLLYGEE